MSDPAFVVTMARPDDAAEIAAIHLIARRQAMPYLRRTQTDQEVRDYFARVVCAFRSIVIADSV